jgi:carbonic anhydrase/acetyltransferase-like protein (isoleucine patch superfamily)
MPDVTIIPFRAQSPKIAASVFLASGCRIAGYVEIEEHANLWFNVSMRGDVHRILIGSETNVQDNTVIHVTSERFSTQIGNRVTIGHSAIIHGCTLCDESLIGMGAIILDGAVIASHCIVAAGSVVPPGRIYPEGSLIVGSPAIAKRQLTEEERRYIQFSWKHYVELAKAYQN